MENKVCRVALIGRPNVGKSTLLNNILKYNLSIVTNVAQTTRDLIKGIYTDKNYQIIFYDTPGIHKGFNLLSERLNQKSYAAISEVDVILFLSEATGEIGKGDHFIIDKIKEINPEAKLIGILTKVDLVNDKNELDRKASDLKALGTETVLGVGLNLNLAYSDVIEELKKYANKEDFEYSEDEFTDVSQRFLAKEYIRLCAIEKLFQELPHSIAVEIDEFSEKEGKPYTIFATLYVKKQSQKGILIGKNASTIKEISINARKLMESAFQHGVYLKVNVKVSPDWVDDEKKIKEMGY